MKLPDQIADKRKSPCTRIDIEKISVLFSDFGFLISSESGSRTVESTVVRKSPKNQAGWF